jgi:hypothetical protein
MLASAVIVPDEPDELDTPEIKTPTLKRRQSGASDPDSAPKRARLSHPPHPSTTAEPSNTPGNDDGEQAARAVRRDSHRDEERKRGQRMFGALLGTLSHKTGSSAAAKKRADTERKQHERLKQMAENASAREKEQLEQLTRQRRRDQWRWDEQAVRRSRSSSPCFS